MAIVYSFDCEKQNRWKKIYTGIFAAVLIVSSVGSYFLLTTNVSYSGVLPVNQSSLVSPNEPYDHQENASLMFPAYSYLNASQKSYYILIRVDCSQLLVDQDKLVQPSLSNFYLSIIYQSDSDEDTGVLYTTAPWIASAVTYNDITIQFESWFLTHSSKITNITLSKELSNAIIDEHLYFAFTVLMPDDLHSISVNPFLCNIYYTVSGFDLNKWQSIGTWSLTIIGGFIAIIFLTQAILSFRVYRQCKNNDVVF